MPDLQEIEADVQRAKKALHWLADKHGAWHPTADCIVCRAMASILRVLEREARYEKTLLRISGECLTPEDPCTDGGMFQGDNCPACQAKWALNDGRTG